jgi:ArsR family metal-binding transcriptional regulator
MGKAAGKKRIKLDARYVYSELPKKNCNECGEESCKAFAEKVANYDGEIEECLPLMRKRMRKDKRERKRLLKELEIESQLYSEEEGYVRANNFGEVIGRLVWFGSFKNGVEPDKHIIVTTEGLAMVAESVYPLKRKWGTIIPGARAYPLKKVIDYKKKETFSGLIPFKENRSLPFLFEVKLIQEESKFDNPWISLMSGPSGSLLIGFDKNSIQPKESVASENLMEFRVIEFPLDGRSKKSIDSFLRLLEYVKSRFDKNQAMNDPLILKNVRRNYCRKFQLEDSLQRVEKRLSGYPLNLTSEKSEETKSSSKKASKGRKKERSKSKRKKAAHRLVTWDTSHYEVLRWERDVTELSKMIKKVTGLKLNWLTGSWKDRLLSDKKMLKKTRILVLTGMDSKGKISNKEVKAIKNFVKEGGALFLSAPTFKGEDTNVLASVFGAEFLWDKIKDEEHHEGKHLDHAIISNFSSHPMCEGVKEVCFGDYGGFPLKIQKKVVSIAQTADSAQPPKAVVMAMAQYGKGSVVFFASSTTFKDKYLVMYDNKKLAANIFSYLSTTPGTPEKTSDKDVTMMPPVTPVEESKAAPIKIEPAVQTLPKSEISVEGLGKEKPVIKRPQKRAVSKQKEVEKIMEPKIPTPSREEVERIMDKLDEKLVLGEIDEVVYEVERVKLRADIEALNQLMSTGKINLKKYMEARNIIDERLSKKLPRANCSSCGEILMGIEEFCPKCGEKTK